MTHPYFNLLAGCIVLITLLASIDLVYIGKHARNKARISAAQLQLILEDMARNAKFTADAEAFLAPLDDGPIQ